MQRTSILATAAALPLALGLAAGGASAAPAVPAYISAAVADTARPDTDKERDANRKPAETLAFAGIKPGARVVELLPGRGYYTRLLSAVVGPKGKVYALALPPRPDAPPDAAAPAAAVQTIAADAHYANVTVLAQPAAELSLPRDVDLVWTSQNYHDFHNLPNVDVINIDKAVFNALKPGGIYLVLDHAAEAGSGLRDTSTLHRIDPQAVMTEVGSVGFKLVGMSEVVRNTSDPHTAKVFDPSIRGHTDQFILKFSKP
jgi:predicted methyltransferase